MDFALNEEQSRWQNEARHFAKEVLLPASLKRDQIEGGREPWDWDIIKAGSKIGFRTFAVPKELGGHGADFVSQGIVMAELAKADSAISKAFSQNWKWSHLISSSCTDDQKERFLKPFVADHSFVIGSASTEPNSGSDNRYPPEGSKFGYRLKAEQQGNDWILNGEKCFIANGSVARLFLIGTRTNPNVPQKEGGTMFAVPVGTPGMRIGKVFNKSGWRFYQNAELIFENCRVPHANVVGEPHKGQKVRSGVSARARRVARAAGGGLRHDPDRRARHDALPRQGPRLRTARARPCIGRHNRADRRSSLLRLSRYRARTPAIRISL